MPEPEGWTLLRNDAVGEVYWKIDEDGAVLLKVMRWDSTVASQERPS